MHFFPPLISLCSRNRVYSSVHPTPLVQGLEDTKLGQEQCRGEKEICKNLLVLQLLGCKQMISEQDCILLILPKKISNSLILERGHKYAVHKWPQMPGLGCLHPRDGQDFTQPCSMFPGPVNRFWSCPDIPNLLCGLYRMLNSVSHWINSESHWITLSFLQHPMARPSCINKHSLAEVRITSLIYVCLDFGLRILIYYLVS